MKYKLLIFDADETLFDFKKTEREALRRTIEGLGLDYEEDYHLKIYKEVNQKIWQELEEGRISQEKLKVERFERFRDRLGLDFGPEELARTYMDHLAQGSFLYEESQELVERLSRTRRLMIITNGLSRVQDIRIKKSSIARYFDRIVVSEELGFSKPDRRIFDLALEGFAPLDKEDILIIGDSLSLDIKGGINYGIDSCWYNKEGLENKEDFSPNYEISSLFDLFRLV